MTAKRTRPRSRRTSSRGPGAPPGNRNAVTHGYYSASDQDPTADLSLDAVIADLAEKQARLSAYIDDHLDDLHPSELVPVFSLFGQNASRLGRLLRDKRAISGEAADGIAGAIAQALDELGTELGVEL